MNGSTGGYGDRSTRQRLSTATQYATETATLESIVVRYEDRADRCTITPRECPADDQLTTWLSADIEAFVDLEDVR
ncbi:hypothetical protein NP511_16260 [Natrinema thermotolerans]|uniref:DUF7511 domain-containing protein n=1 Tax=Natrinema thermotolerans TaxID=121872 RepID=A0AAF0PAI0_9EURY|nr:hypothetical protein [Natrinema thermotolerans]ELZ13056.1 hypothetical protein C478_09053 [Natrinema thermotolerans DSM 11552]QCC59927.1 hypothetical protein DVR14_15355 [Natrinema thermotolerans]WMT06929.1 hypothetical protein NP511_16260 [Natrinema thermotolerans]